MEQEEDQMKLSPSIKFKEFEDYMILDSAQIDMALPPNFKAPPRDQDGQR